MTENVFLQHGHVNKIDRELQSGHKAVILWFTGLSGAGKSTLAHAVEKVLFDRGCRTFVIDGDNVRHGLCSDLGFNAYDRQENIRRIGEVSNLFLQAGIITLTAFISPFRSDRNRVRTLVGENRFIEIYCNADLDVCEQRDVKGLYAKARCGEVAEFTGISSPYEVPIRPELVINTGLEPLDVCVNEIISYLEKKAVINI